MKKQGIFPSTEDDIHSFPSIILLQFGIDKSYRGFRDPYTNKRYSHTLIGHMFNTVYEIASLSGCVFITLEATPNSVPFYSEYEFITFKERGIIDSYEYMLYYVSNLFVE